MAKTIYKTSPFGVAVHPWLNKPDTKFAAGGAGVYQTGLRLEGAEALKFKEEITAAADAAFAELTEELTPGERKKWSVYYPFEEEEDDAGNPTGAIVFDFKQNAEIRLKDGTTKRVQIGLQDSAGNDITKPIFGGSTIRLMYSTRAIPMKSNKQAGVRLDFSMAQVLKLVQGGGGRGFGKVDGGYVDEPDADEPGTTSGSSNTAGGSPHDGDY